MGANMMISTESRHPHDIGMIGLGVMGRNFAMNMADHGFSVAGYDNDRLKVEALREETAGRDISAADTIPDFISLLRRPRAIMMLVPAGAPVDSVIRDVLPHLEKGDLIIDGGNSFFKDTDTRVHTLAAQGIHFMGVGVSGGEEGALHAAMIIAYAQGFALLAAASERYKYQLDLEAVARIWRGGCIIRAGLLEDIRGAFHARRDLANILLDPSIAQKVLALLKDLRRVVCQAAELAVPAPGLMVSLGYCDAYRSAWLPANLIQAQRDYFGAHTYERIDAKGTFHTEWEKK